MKNLPKDLKKLELSDKDRRACQRYIRFYRQLNDEKYPDLETLARGTGVKVSSLKRKITLYNKRRRELVEKCEALRAILPPLDKRRRISADAMESIEKARARIMAAKKLVVTAAQYGAEVNTEALASLKAYAKKIGALVVVMPIRYGKVHIYNKDLDEFQLSKELSTIITEDPEILVLPVDRNHPNENLFPFGEHVVLNAMRITPTRKKPLTALDASEGTLSQIVASPKMHFAPVPVSSERETMPKVHHSTGSITYPDYDEHVAGIKAAEVHCFGGLVVERDRKDHFHIRQLLANDQGEFYDIDGTFYAAGKITPLRKKESAVDALVLGDYHNVLTDPVARAAVFGKGGQIDVLRPKYVVLHDFFDGWSISHHHDKNGMMRQRKSDTGSNRLAWELNAAIIELRWMISQYPDVQFVMVSSNHNEHLDRYLLEKRFQNEPHNARIGNELFWMCVDNPDKSAFQLYVESRLDSQEVSHIRFLQRDDDFIIHGIDLSLHGDVGPKGARGSAVNIDRIGHRSIIGHSHCPCILDKCWQVGLMAYLRLEYNSGPSDWMHTNGIVYKNGQRQLVNLIAGQWHVSSPDFRGAEIPAHFRPPFEDAA